MIAEKELIMQKNNLRNHLIEKQIGRRNTKNKVFKGVIIAGTVISTLPLLLILFYIFRQGISAISWNFLTNLPSPVGESGGGVANALVGALVVTPDAISVGLDRRHRSPHLLQRVTGSRGHVRSPENRTIYGRFHQTD